LNKTLLKTQKIIQATLSDTDKAAVIKAFFELKDFQSLPEPEKETVKEVFPESLPSRVIADMRIPQSSLLLKGKTLLGKTLLIETLKEVIKQKRKENLRKQVEIAGTIMPDDERLKKNRELDRFEKSSRVYFVSEAEIHDAALKYDDADFKNILYEIKEANLVLLDELFYSSNWTFHGSEANERVKGRMKLLWERIRDYSRNPEKVFIGTTNNDYMEIIPISILKSRIAETFPLQIVLKGKGAEK